MGTTKVTNGLLIIIALTLMWIALKPNGGARPGSVAVVQTASAQTERNTVSDEEVPLEAICTLRAVDEGAAQALIGGLQNEVLTALNQTNQTLWTMQGQVADIPLSLNQMESALQKIAQNTRPYGTIP